MSNPVNTFNYALDTKGYVFAYRVLLNQLSEVGSDRQNIVLTGADSTIRRGDIVLIKSGALLGYEIPVKGTTGNIIELAYSLPSDVGVGIFFDIYRHRIGHVDSEGKAVVKNTEYGTLGLPNFYWSILGLFEVPTTVIGDPTTGIPASVTAVGSVGTLSMQGAIAHDSADSQLPLKIGGRAHSSVPTSVTAGDMVNAYFDTTGHQHIKVDDLPTGVVNTSSISELGTLFQIDAGANRQISMHFTGTWTATITFQISNDGTNWVSFPMQNVASPTTAQSATLTTSNAIIQGAIPTAYFRAQVTIYTSGTISCRYWQTEVPSMYSPITTVTATVSGTVTASNTAGNVAHDGVDSGNPVKVGRRAVTAHVTAVANNDRVDSIANTRGFTGVTGMFDNRSDTFTAAANGTTIDCSFNPFKKFSLQVVATGAVTSWEVVLEGSNNNVNFTTIITHTNADVSAVKSHTDDFPCRYFRARCSAIVLGAGTNVIAYILGVQ